MVAPLSMITRHRDEVSHVRTWIWWHGGGVESFSFRHSWRLPVDVETVYAALADVDAYPRWWPQVVRIARIDGTSGHAFVRSLLPFTLDLVLTREVEDPHEHVLRVRIAGDLEGWSEWRLSAVAGDGPDRTIADYAQEVVVTAQGLHGPPALVAPVLRANHAWMMWSGQRGLVAYLRT